MKKILILTLMIFWDWSLHLVELLKIEKYYFLYPYFPTREFYTIFWTIYWGVAFLISLNLLFNMYFKK